jgi:predicted dehydrogenase
MGTRIRWGILGLGSIAETFAKALSFSENGQLVAVGSRDKEKARRFGKKFGASHFHGSYQLLADDKDVDIVYIATPHNSHRENTLMCLNAGKHVLCEKPFAVNAAEARAMVGCARGNKLFLMEAMWTRFLPLMDKVRQLLSEEAVGEIRMLAADFGFRYADKPKKQRILDSALAGGALLDVGVYPLALSSMIFGKPSRIQSAAFLGESSVDEQAGIVLGFDKGRLSIIYTAVQTETPHEAAIMGTKGMIKLHRSWWCGNKLTLVRLGKPDEFMELPSHSAGFLYEIEAAQQAVRDGKLECALMPLDETVSIAETMDIIRKQWGLKYPFE